MGLSNPQRGGGTAPWTIAAVGIDHYENFPVASVLCPPHWRPPILAIYRFARTADDIADEGDAPPAQRHADLDAYEAELLACTEGQAVARWPQVFEPLARQISEHRLPRALLLDLLSAFRQDTGNPLYADRAALLDYCRRSANPIGRLLLHLAGITNPQALRESDAICSALQLINFWQDLSVDLPRGRCYVTRADALRHGLPWPLPPASDPALRTAMPKLVRDCVGWARELMTAGAPLPHRLRGRFGWELRFVVQGGWRILEKIEAQGFDTLARRPVLGLRDALPLAWRALAMRPGRALPQPAPGAAR